MTRPVESIHGQWSSRWVFIMAATGSAVGLGNIWRFPYMTGENGGGAFVLIYLACVALVGIPIMMAEVLLGRRGRQSPINTMRALSEEEGVSSNWKYLGWLGVAAGFLILSFYSVVGGWTIAYIVRTASGFLNAATAETAGAAFAGLTGSPETLLAWHTVFMVMVFVVVSRGVKAGLEKAVRWLMPLLFILLLVLVGYAMGTGEFRQAIAYLFEPDFSKISAAGVLAAMGQAFFSLSLGMGAIMIYGSYLPANASIPQTSVIIALVDTVVALLAGLAIFPLVFAFDLQPAGGAGLIFKTLPIAFGQMPGGQVFGSLFFVLLMVAAWTSAISLLEPVVAWLVENHGASRVKASFCAACCAWLLGVFALLSLNVWADYTIFGKGFFDLLDYLTANIMLPLGGILIAVFAGWRVSKVASMEEMGLGDGPVYEIWRFVLRYIAPVGVILIFLNVLGII